MGKARKKVGTTPEELGWDAEWQAAYDAMELPVNLKKTLYVARVSIGHGGTYMLMSDRGRERALLQGKLKRAVRMKTATKPVVGDWVLAEVSEHHGASIITHILPRRSKFSRAKVGMQTVEQILATNIDYVFVLTSMNSEFSVRRLERYFTQARVGGVQPVLVLTKKDICPKKWLQEFVDEAETVVQGAPIHLTSAVTGEGLKDLLSYFSPRKTVSLLGSSGVGKSTLVNAMLGNDRQSVNEIREDDKGRHTTSYREMLLMPGGGLIIDNPGIREIQLFGADEHVITETFDEIEELAGQCKFNNCKHLTEPGCAVKAAVDEGELDEERLFAWHKLLESRSIEK